MTREELDAIRARAEAATKGPWACADPMKYDKMQVTGSMGQVCKTDLYGFEYPQCWDNGDFIAHARTDIPALLSYIAELEAKLAHRERALNHLARIYPCSDANKKVCPFWPDKCVHTECEDRLVDMALDATKEGA